MVTPNDLQAARHTVEVGTASLLIGLRRRQGFELKKLEITELVGAEFRDAALAFLQDLSRRHLRELEVGYKPDSHEALVFEEGTALHADLLTTFQNLAAVDGFDPEDPTAVRRLSFYSVGFHTDDATAILLKRSKPAQPLDRRRLSVLFRNNRIDRIGEPVLSFDTEFDILLYEDWGVAVSAAGVQSMLRDLDELRASVDANVESIHRRFPIANVEEFVEACRRDPRMMTKLHSVAQKDYLNQVTIDDIRHLIRSYELPEDLLDDNGRFVYDGHPERRWLILKVLDDDYLESATTQRRYEVNSKVPR